jgi:hypothetical protein
LCQAADPPVPYTLSVKVVCNPDSNDDSIQFVGSEGSECGPVMTYSSGKGCPLFSLGAFSKFLDEYYYLWGAALIILGGFLCFFGNKFVNLVIFLIVALAVFCILGSLFFYMFLNKVNEDWQKWVAIGVIIAVSLGLGYFAMRLRKWGITIVAAWAGVMFGFILTTSFIVDNEYVYWAILVVCAIVAAFLAFKIETAVICAITSFVGGYCLVRGVSLYVGGFPNETQLHQEIKSGAVDWEAFDKKFYIYLGAIVVATILGFYFQWKREGG